MLLNKLYIVLIMLLVVSCQSRNAVEDSMNGEVLNGDVKEIYERSFLAYEENGKVLKGKHKRKSGIDLNYVQKYDAEGRLIEYGEYAASTGKLVYKSLISYNVIGCKETQESVNSQASNNTKRRFIYDERNNLIEVDYYDARGNLIQRINNTYNDKNFRTIQRCFRNDGSLKWQYTYLYNSNGQVIEEVRDEEGQQFNYTTIFVYNRKGYLIEEISKDAEYSFNKRYIYKYNNDGDKVLEMSYNGSGELQSRIAYTYNSKHLRESVSEVYAGALKPKNSRFVYEYDHQDNWIHRIEYIDGVPAYWVDREVVYY